MKKVRNDEQKRMTLEMLLYLDKLCRDNNIKYSLCGGTLLGAIRHKGFIPWDDDADIFLMREEYNCLLRLLRTESKYKLLTPDTKNYFYTYSKIYDPRTILKTSYKFDSGYDSGIFIDIFPIDNIPDDEVESWDFYNNLKKLKNNMLCSTSFYYSGTTMMTTIAKLFLLTREHFKVRNTEASVWKRRLTSEIQKYDGKASHFKGVIPSRYGMKERLGKSVFEKTNDILFEGYKLMVISEFDTYLTALYGRYMELPPLKKQKREHKYYTIYWR